MKHVFEQLAACTACKATGLYIGMAEHDGAAVICHTCKGTGARTLRIEWEDFEGRQPHLTAKHVYETSSGISLGTGKEGRYVLSDFGGMPYKEWLDGKSFARGMENRGCTCPAWWYQSANYKLKPDWEACIIGGVFSGCDSFKNKGMCWSRFDRENPT